MSLKRIPSVGKSLMSRIFALRSAMFIARLYYYALNAAARKTRRRCARVTLDGRSRENHRRATGATKVLGRRTGESPHASYHRGISYRVLEAYADRITDPIRRYFEEIGVGAPLEARFQKPSTGSGLKHA